ncbi:MAG: hypothetical protein ABJP79_12410 [Tateyamaria sp.]|uniref:hypothetical protein n=1 Tax=Tateyamaria sp. TaxID=1929288 RepID=UPI00329DFF8E
MDKANQIAQDGFAVFHADPEVSAWVRAAYPVAVSVASDPVVRAQQLRHGDTWFVGVDVLPNAKDGSINGVALGGAWRDVVPDIALHEAQLSIVYPGYPKRDAAQSEANHRFRIDRFAAHVDGLLLEGAARRRFAREFHAYILGVPLNDVTAAPTIVWPGSHKIMQCALVDAVEDKDLNKVDLTQAYHAARRKVFETCAPVAIRARPGDAFLIHRFALHGTAPWESGAGPGRMIAFFRPEFARSRDWLG